MKIETAQFMRAAHTRRDLVADGLPQVAFAGRSNVGKSSLLNRLLGRKSLARISSSPGRTRAVNYFLINSRFYFVDLPGYGYAKVGRDERRAWARLIETYLKEALPIARVIQLVDAKVGATPLDVQAVEYLHGLGGQPTVVATKIDKVPRGRRTKALNEIRQALSMPEESPPLPFSARTGEGLGELWGDITAFLATTGQAAN